MIAIRHGIYKKLLWYLDLLWYKQFDLLKQWVTDEILAFTHLWWGTRNRFCNLLCGGRVYIRFLFWVLSMTVMSLARLVILLYAVAATFAFLENISHPGGTRHYFGISSKHAQYLNPIVSTWIVIFLCSLVYYFVNIFLWS